MKKTCFECDAAAEEQHHPIPQSLGGQRTIPLCSPCHGKAHSVGRGSIPALTKLGMQRAAAAGVRLGRPSQRDPEITARIVKLYADGMGLREICRLFEAEGVPTVNGRNIWHPSTILAALKANERDLEHAKILAGLSG